MDTRQEERVIDAFNKRERSLQYGLNHIVLSNFGTQDIDIYKLAAGVLFLDKIGSGHSGFFNGFAPSHTGFHFQYIQERLPIWYSVDTQQDVSIFGGKVFISNLKNWFFQAYCFFSQNTPLLVRAGWNYIEESPNKYDLLFNYDEPWYRCIPVRRRARKPVSFSITEIDDYGDFGGMELSGIIVTVKTKKMFEELQKEDSQGILEKRVKFAFQEICW